MKKWSTLFGAPLNKIKGGAPKYMRYRWAPKGNQRAPRIQDTTSPSPRLLGSSMLGLAIDICSMVQRILQGTILISTVIETIGFK